jgi:hypothetical protein
MALPPVLFDACIAPIILTYYDDAKIAAWMTSKALNKAGKSGYFKTGSSNMTHNR